MLNAEQTKKNVFTYLIIQERCCSSAKFDMNLLCDFSVQQATITTQAQSCDNVRRSYGEAVTYRK